MSTEDSRKNSGRYDDQHGLLRGESLDVIKMTGPTKKPLIFGPKFVKTRESTHVRTMSALTLACVCFTPNNKKKERESG